MRTVTLNNGVEMPILGFGVYQVPAEQTEDVVAQALNAGYRPLSSDEMSQIADMDTGASLFFDHRDPAIVSQFSKRHLDV